MNEVRYPQMSEWAKLRRRVDQPCQQCGAPMVQVVKKQRYCSRGCQERAYRQRVKERQAGG